MEIRSAAALEDLQRMKLYQLEQVQFYEANRDPSNVISKIEQASASKTGGSRNGAIEAAAVSNAGYDVFAVSRPVSGFSLSRNGEAKVFPDIEASELKKKS